MPENTYTRRGAITATVASMIPGVSAATRKRPSPIEEAIRHLHKAPPNESIMLRESRRIARIALQHYQKNLAAEN